MHPLLPILLVSGLVAPPPPSVKAIVGATVVDPSGVRMRDAVVLIRGDRIDAVGPRSRVRVPDGADRVDAAARS